ncbi:ABC transporter ATP-binding protein [Bradyrhizobium sp. BRP56]|uniref:ABC transporter ATP-binding protein n=1 Tax=Bradyrhizobium sp. BRP56 TaxID=2793819 RepID=UPI001CD27681|nr:ABC transporter ATP-binding protein [Bradyrhizobium sp. BRP56]
MDRIVSRAPRALPVSAVMTPLLEVKSLSKFYPIKRGGRGARLRAVDDVDLTIGAGESVGLVGESGCGKSTMVRLLGRLIDPTVGRVLIGGEDLTAVTQAQFAASPRRRRIQVVFQDATESLNPSFRAFQAIADPLKRLLGMTNGAELDERVRATAALVGLPEELLQRYPHQLSGGQRARVGIARAVAVEPSLLILDEPTSALDVSVQAVILRLLADLRARLSMSYLFVSHDLNVVRLLCSRVVVMYLGKIVEIAPAETLFTAPRHPYTQALVAAIPDPARRGEARVRLDGSPSSPIDPDPNVCRFYGRCPKGADICSRAMPTLRAVGPDHFAACHFAPSPPGETDEC